MATKRTVQVKGEIKKRKKKPGPKIGLRANALTLPIDLLYSAYHAAGEYQDLKTKGGARPVATVDMNDISIPVVKSLLALEGVPPAVKDGLQKFLDTSPEELLMRHIGSPHEAFGALRFIMHAPNPVIEFELNGVWYPAPISVQYWNGWFLSECALRLRVQAQDQTVERSWYISDRDFLSPSELPVKKTLAELLQKLGLRLSTKERLAVFRNKLMRSEQMSERSGLTVDVTKSVLVEVNLGWRTVLLPYELGSKSSPKTLIIENELEASRDTDRAQSEKVYVLPILRAFSPKMKKYVYVDVDDVTEHTYNTNVRDLLVLPEKLRMPLDAVFDTPPEQVFGDLFDGRHGGVVILAAGGPGVGKTLTAEVYSESTRRPLYVMEMGELGTSLAVVEQNLQRIFDRARRWNAVLLFDEADIFLAKRQGLDLERDAIVATFLRLLDYYEGTFFLTTNREDVIDPAFRSRVTLRLAYPDLADESRARVWSQLLHKAGLEFSDSLEVLAKEDLNGRNIRNAIRVLKMLHPKTHVVGMKEVTEALEFISRPPRLPNIQAE